VRDAGRHRNRGHGAAFLDLISAAVSVSSSGLSPIRPTRGSSYRRLGSTVVFSTSFACRRCPSGLII
jgi:hypothetical protein